MVRQLAERIRHFHLKDAVGRPGMFGDTFVFPLLGEGVVPWDYYRQVLGSDPVEAARLSMELLRRLDR